MADIGQCSPAAFGAPMFDIRHFSAALCTQKSSATGGTGVRLRRGTAQVCMLVGPPATNTLAFIASTAGCGCDARKLT